MSDHTTPDPRWRELAQRTADGVRVTLLWSAAEDAVTVVVADLFADEFFQLSVPSDHARYAFEHPYAYAASQGLDYDALAHQAA
jgi:hypothetical protein